MVPYRAMLCFCSQLNSNRDVKELSAVTVLWLSRNGSISFIKAFSKYSSCGITRGLSCTCMSPNQLQSKNLCQIYQALYQCIARKDSRWLEMAAHRLWYVLLGWNWLNKTLPDVQHCRKYVSFDMFCLDVLGIKRKCCIISWWRSWGIIWLIDGTINNSDQAPNTAPTGLVVPFVSRIDMSSVSREKGYNWSLLCGLCGLCTLWWSSACLCWDKKLYSLHSRKIRK